MASPGASPIQGFDCQDSDFEIDFVFDGKIKKKAEFWGNRFTTMDILSTCSALFMNQREVFQCVASFLDKSCKNQAWKLNACTMPELVLWLVECAIC